MLVETDSEAEAEVEADANSDASWIEVDSDALVEAEVLTDLDALVEAEIETLSLTELDVETEACCSSSLLTVPKTAWSEVARASVPSTTFSTATCSLAWTCV